MTAISLSRPPNLLQQPQNSEIPEASASYGTPTTGSDLINIAKLVGYGIGVKIPLVRPAVNVFLRSQRQLTDLATGSEFLTRLHTEWAFRVVNGGHEKAGAGRMWLAVRAITGDDDFAVKEASGKGVYGAVDWEPLDYGHIQLVKPGAANDDRFLAAKRFLQIARRMDPSVLDRVWKASQEIWGNRFSRVSENLEFFTAIDQRQCVSNGRAAGKALAGFGKCETICRYEFILEKDCLELGISFGDNDLWRRQFPPVYIHQIGLNLLPQKEKAELRSAVDSILENPKDEVIWSLFFPKVSIKVNDIPLEAGEFEWPDVARRYANWLLRRYKFPKDHPFKVGAKVRLKIEYDSVVPSSLPHFVFSTPWIVHGAKVRILVEGDFEYFVPSHRIVPGGRGAQLQDATVTRREVQFSYDEIMLPGSAMEVRWHRKN